MWKIVCEECFYPTLHTSIIKRCEHSIGSSAFNDVFLLVSTLQWEQHRNNNNNNNNNNNINNNINNNNMFCFPPCFPLANLEKQKQHYQHVMHITMGSILKERKTIHGMYTGVLIHFLHFANVS